MCEHNSARGAIRFGKSGQVRDERLKPDVKTALFKNRRAAASANFIHAFCELRRGAKGSPVYLTETGTLG